MNKWESRLNAGAADRAEQALAAKEIKSLREDNACLREWQRNAIKLYDIEVGRLKELVEIGDEYKDTLPGRSHVVANGSS